MHITFKLLAKLYEHSFTKINKEKMGLSIFNVYHIIISSKEIFGNKSLILK